MKQHACAPKANRQTARAVRRAASAGGKARALVPPDYGIDYLDARALHAAAARGTRGAGGPLPHLAAIQSSFGQHDLSGIRAYTGPTAAKASVAMGAQAFACGNKVAFAGTPTLRVAAHEAAHVVQQRAGVHLQGGVGEAGDKYERQADAVAERVVQGQSAEGLLGSAAPGPGSGAPAVQRSVGFEIELRAEDWNIWTLPKEGEAKKAPPKGTPIIYGKDFTLQAEYAGEDKAIAELVTDDPGLQTRNQFHRSVRDMQRLGRELDARASNSSLRASGFTGGDPDFTMEKKGNQSINSAVLQVTAGVPLDSVPALFSNLEGVKSMPNPQEYRQARERAEQVGKTMGGASDELKGLMVLLHQYLSQLQGAPSLGGKRAPTQTYVKGLIKVMARTDFHAMFELLPEEEQTSLKQNMDTWIAAMLSAQGKEEDAPLPGEEGLVSPIITDPGSSDPAMRITTTRESWLKNLPGRDLLTYGGRPSGISDVEVFPARSRREIETELLGKKKPPKKLQQEYLTAQSTDPGRFGTPSKAKMPFFAKNQRKLLASIESLYMGLGSLGGKMDFIQYQHEPAEEGAPVNPDNYTGAPIIEIRNPPNLGAVENWYPVARRIWDAVAEAIQFPQGRGSGALKRKYENVLTPKQLEKRQQAKARAQAVAERIKALDESTE